MKVDLDLMPTDDIVGVLMDRFDHGYFIAAQELNDEGGRFYYRHTGDAINRGGLNAFARRVIMEELDDE